METEMSIFTFIHKHLRDGCFSFLFFIFGLITDHDRGEQLLDVDGGRCRVAGDVCSLWAVGGVHADHEVGQDGGQLGAFALWPPSGQLARGRRVHGLAVTFITDGRVLKGRRTTT